MRTLVDIYDDQVRVNKRLVNARRNQDLVAYQAAAQEWYDLDSELIEACKPIREAVKTSKRKDARIRKTVSKTAYANIAKPPPESPALRSSLDSVEQGPKGALASCPKRRAKHSTAYVGSRRRNLLERSPIEGSGASDRHATPGRLKASLPALAPLSPKDRAILART